ncbi:MAG: DUF4827 domain-containing protein [Bacteroidaceae bacterium]|nr:DUF4827 domain-containing protein [Bacteroidaceae bacterium]
MKHIHILLCAICAMALAACDNTETYADQKEREQRIIDAFLVADTKIMVGDELLCHVGKIDVITEEEFLKDTITECKLDDKGNYIKNEYVRLNTGVIMQIVRRGVGDMLNEVNGVKTKVSTSKQIVARYFEYDMSSAYVPTRNTTSDYHRYPDIIDATVTYGTITGSFNTAINGGGAMYRNYASTVVPEGWLVPLHYVRLGHQTDPDNGIARVRLIIPHSLGHTTATTEVHPYFYEITFEELH